MVLENSPKFKETIAQKRTGEGTVRKNLEDIALAAIKFSEKLIPLGVTLLADASLLERHRHVADERGRGPKEVFDLVAAYIDGGPSLMLERFLRSRPKPSRRRRRRICFEAPDAAFPAPRFEESIIDDGTRSIFWQGGVLPAEVRHESSAKKIGRECPKLADSFVIYSK